VNYSYRYEQPPPDASEEVRAATARRNVSKSLEMDSLRVGMGPSATELHARAVAATNGRSSARVVAE
jgi:hypothetical protein